MIKWIVAFSISNLDNDIPIFLNYYLVDTKIISVQSTVEIFNISNYSSLNIFSKLIMKHVEFISDLIYSGCRRRKLRFLGVLEGVINFLKTNETYLKLKFIFDLFDQLDSRSSQTGFQANDERMGGCRWEGNLISHRLESNRL